MPEACTTFYLNKLVRDKIPASHEAVGGSVRATVLEGFPRFEALSLKVDHEADELFANPSDPGEAADVIEALMGMGLMYGFSREHFLDVAGRAMIGRGEEVDGAMPMPEPSELRYRELLNGYLGMIASQPTEPALYTGVLCMALSEAYEFGGQSPDAVLTSVASKHSALGGFASGIFVETATVPRETWLHEYYSKDPERFPVVAA